LPEHCSGPIPGGDTTFTELSFNFNSQIWDLWSVKTAALLSFNTVKIKIKVGKRELSFNRPEVGGALLK
jgi:hypothetical protein